MIENLIVFVVLISLGIFFKWKQPGGIEADTARHVINTTIMNFFFPAFCFKVISTMPVDMNMILVPTTAIVTIFTSVLISFLIYTLIEKFTSLSKKEKGVLILAASFSNVTFFGLPILTGLYGADAARYVLLYDLMATTPLLWILGATIASSYGKGRRLTIKESFKTIFELVPTWALIAGFGANFLGFHPTGVLLRLLDLMSTPIIAMMIFSVGLAITVPKLKHALIALPSVLIRLCLAPLIAFTVASFLGIDGLALKSSIMEAAMPTMVLVLMVVSKYKLDHTLAALTIIMSIAIAFITIPLTAYLIKGF